jgi:hypothetical protein
LLVAQSFALTTIAFSGNVSEDEFGIKRADFKYRATAVWAVPGLGFVVSAFASAEITASATGTNTSGNATISGDFVLGAVKFVTNTLPCVYLGYLGATVNANRKIDTVAQTDVTNFNYAAAGGFVLTSFIRLEEREPSGTATRTINLRELVWLATAGNSSNGLHYITISAIPDIVHLAFAEKLSFTFLVSEVIGVVNIGSVQKVIVAPKQVESIIEIDGWKYKSTANHLTLVCGVAVGAAAGEHSKMVTFSSGSGKNEVFVNFAGKADIDGSLKGVVVKKSVAASLSIVTDDISIQASAQTVYGGAFGIGLVEVDFTAGANHIIYDPTTGSGQPIIDSAVSNFLFVLLLAVVVLLI